MVFFGPHVLFFYTAGKTTFYRDFILKKVIGKIKKLRQKYKSIKDKANKSDNSANPKREWKFFQEIDKFMCTKHNISPPSLIDIFVDPIDPENEDADDNSSKHINHINR